ncbi:NAD(P)/FAD-dependent oxidoreductase [Streptomyces sp. NPDC002577]
MTGHAVVLGCGVAGILAAAALADHADSVTVIDRDRLPHHPRVRKGIPQGRHTHGLLSSGALAMDALLPGAFADLIAAGAQRIPMSDALIYGPHGWMRPARNPHFIVGASRPLTEHSLRDHLTRRYPHTVRFLEHTDVTALLGDARRVRGVRVRRRGDGQSGELTADLVVDAGGRGSKTPRWLTELGLPAVRSTVVDCGLVYASATVTADPGLLVPVINLTPDPRPGTPGTGGFLLRIEDGQWSVTLSGTRGVQPPLNESDFRYFARNLRHPLLGEQLAHTELTTRISAYRGTANRRHHYDRMPAWPRGLLVLGDAATTFNPLYGQGMTVAALSALWLHHTLQRFAAQGAQPLDRLDHFTAQRAICRRGRLPWTICTAEDIRYVGARGPTPTTGLRLAQRLADRFRATAACDPRLARIFFDLISLTVPVGRLLSPATALSLVRGPLLPCLEDPPLPHGGAAALTAAEPAYESRSEQEGTA